MALSVILRRSASGVIGGGNRFYGNLILPGASVASLRRFCSSPCMSSKDNESVLGDAKKPSLDESLVKDLISQVQSLQRDIESLRKSYSKPVSAVEEDESSLVESESIFKGLEDDSSLKGKALESSNDEGEDSESNESDVDSKDESDDDSNDEGEDDKSDDDSNDEGEDDKSDDDSKDEGEEDSKDKSSSEIDYSNDESLSETDDNQEYSDRESDDKSIPESKENEELLKGIQQEIVRAKKFMELSAPDATIPDKFPFTIKDYGNSSIVLSGEYEGEFVEVQVESPTVFTYKNCHDYSPYKNCHDYSQKKSAPYSMDLTVAVSSMRAKSKKVELKCGARPEGISIYAAKDPADGSDNEGVHMSELNENLKQEFVKYLEARGITLSTTNFIYKYMLDKANKERLRILENIEKMVV